MDKNSHGQGGEENAGERGITAAMVVVGNRARGHGVVATKKKIEGEENSMGSGLISPVVITPDTLKLAPDRTRLLHTGPVRREFLEHAKPPDARLASCATRLAQRPHQTHHTRRAYDTVHEFDVCPTAKTVHRTHRERLVQRLLQSLVPSQPWIFSETSHDFHPTKFQLIEDSNKHQLELV